MAAFLLLRTKQNENESNKRVQGTLHKVSGPLTRDVGGKKEKLWPLQYTVPTVTNTPAFAWDDG